MHQKLNKSLFILFILIQFILQAQDSIGVKMNSLGEIQYSSEIKVYNEDTYVSGKTYDFPGGDGNSTISYLKKFDKNLNLIWSLKIDSSEVSQIQKFNFFDNQLYALVIHGKSSLDLNEKSIYLYRISLTGEILEKTKIGRSNLRCTNLIKVKNKIWFSYSEYITTSKVLTWPYIIKSVIIEYDVDTKKLNKYYSQLSMSFPIKILEINFEIFVVSSVSKHVNTPDGGSNPFEEIHLIQVKDKKLSERILHPFVYEYVMDAYQSENELVIVSQSPGKYQDTTKYLKISTINLNDHVLKEKKIFYTDHLWKNIAFEYFSDQQTTWFILYSSNPSESNYVQMNKNGDLLSKISTKNTGANRFYFEGDTQYLIRDSILKITHEKVENIEPITIIESENKFGFQDGDGNLLVSPIYESADPFHEGLSKVKLLGKYGFVNKHGNIIIPIIYDYADNFHEEIARVQLGAKYGYVSITGDLNILPIYDSASCFINGIARVKVNNHFTYLQKKNKSLVTQLKTDGSNDGLLIVRFNKRFGCVDLNGVEIVPPVYDTIEYFTDYLKVKNGKNYGLIDKKGKLVTEVKYKFIGAFSEGVAIVYINNKFGYIDRQGHEIIPAIYDLAYQFIAGNAFVRLDKEYGFIDLENKKYTPLPYDLIYQIDENLFTMRLNGLFGIMDASRKEIVPFIYESIGEDDESFVAGLCRVQQKGKFGYIDHSFKIVIPILYDKAYFNYPEEYGYFEYEEPLLFSAEVTIGERTFYIDETGKEIENPWY